MLLGAAQRRSMDGYVFYFERRTSGAPRLGILISRRHAALAVERNRIKRSIREAFRLEQENLGSLDLLVRPPYRRSPGNADMVSRLRALLRRLAP